MKALICYGPGDYRLETAAVPRATADDIIVKVEACRICAGDIKTHLGPESFWAATDNQDTSRSR
jgi:threonine dehydrogenase-like Zn-dependent dehydrogenase